MKINNPLELLFTFFYQRSLLYSPQFSLYPIYQFSIQHKSLPLLHYIHTHIDKNNELKENYEDLLFESYYYEKGDIYQYLQNKHKENPNEYTIEYPSFYTRDISNILLSSKSDSTSSIAPSQ